MILVDTSVLIDVIEQQPVWAEWSVERLNDRAMQHPLAINVVIYAEISRSFADAISLDLFLRSANIKVDAISNRASFAAAKAHTAYRAAGGTRQANLPDFSIGAHAQEAGYALLTRDPVRKKNLPS